jgi:hypothetical protein
MTDSPDWPTYQVGPKDSIFALGVVSANCARFEFALHGMFTTILGVDGPLGARLMFKMSPEMRDRMMRELLPTKEWPENVIDLSDHFIKAHKTLYENRNKLMHSNVVSFGSQRSPLFYKTNRDGRTVLSHPTINELRRVADDMMTYFDYGLHLSNKINFDLLGMRPLEGNRFYGTWPDKPPPPIPLEYTSDPIPSRAQ